LITTNIYEYLRTRRRASTSPRWYFPRRYVVIATKPVHRLHIRPIMRN